MKKISIALCLAGLVSFASADIFSLSAGYGYEQQNIGGYVKSDRSKNYFGVKKVDPDTDPFRGYFGLKDKSHPYFWVKLIHPLPIIPNIKFQYTKYETSGHSDYIAGNIKIFNDVRINTPVFDAETYMSIDSYDATLFYELKPVFADIEFGLGADYWKGKFKIYDNKNQRYVVNSSGSVILPYLYGRLESAQIYGFSVLAHAKLAQVGDKHHYDLLGAVKYTIDIPGPVNPFIKAGYKYKEAYYEDDNDNVTTLNFRGAFLEIGVKF